MAMAEFDSIADVYDETRRALDPDTLKGIEGMLTKHGCRTILEIGVGTGRVAVPLKRDGFEVVGADISRRMIERARAKGIRNLMLADGGRTPFRDDEFDATLMAHVFHLLADPMVVMKEAARVSRVGVFALLRKGVGDRPWFPFFGGGGPPVPSGNAEDEATRRLFEQRRESFRRIAEKYNWTWDPSQRLHNWRRESEILETLPPDDLAVVSDKTINETFDDRMARFEKGGFSFMTRMPEQMRKEIIEEMRKSAASYPGRSLPRHEVYQVALWRSERLLS